MGNNQSTPGHHNRLSKPKTNTNSPGPLHAADSPISVSSRYAYFGAKSRCYGRETPQSSSETETRTGSVVQQSKNEDAVGELAPRPRERAMSIISRSNSRTNSRTNSRSNSLSCFRSRQVSNARLTDLHGSKTSPATNAVDLDAAIRLLQDVKRNGSPEDLAALHEALETTDNERSTIEPGLSRRTSAADGSSLTRRRSLVQTPGVATRSSPVEGRRSTWNSWRAPQIAPEEEAKWAVTPKGIEPLNHLAVPSATSDSHNSPAPRARTPNEMDYSHLGNLRLGTLSIVNGAPSPAASTKMAKHRSYHGGEVDYSMTADVRSGPLMMNNTPWRGHVKRNSVGFPIIAPFFNDTGVPGTDLMPQAVTRYDDQHDTRKNEAYMSQSLIEPAKSIRVTNEVHDSNLYAQDYQAYIPDSPFTTTKFSRNEQDDGVGEEEENSNWNEAAQILTGTMFDAPQTAMDTLGSTLFSRVPDIEVQQKQAAKSSWRPTLRTSDSGYSSGGSLQVGTIGLQSAGSMNSSNSNDSTRAEQVMSPGLSPGAGSSASLGQPGPRGTPDLECRREPESLRMLERLERPSTADSLLLPLSPCSAASKSSTDSTRSATQKRLQRRRPSQPELPVIQSCQSIPEGTIPDIPSNVQAKFARRLSHTPDMDCLTHTYPSKDHVIMTAESGTDASSDALTEPVVQLRELEPERPRPPPAHTRHRSLSMFRRRSTAESKDTEKENMNTAMGVVDLGTIANSLGSSPYDAAMSAPQCKMVTCPTHPHQLGGALPRAKSMVKMDSEAAAAFGRMRSKDRASMEQEMPQTRRRSYHNLKEVSNGKAYKRRPLKALHDIPPVPAIDASRLKAPLSARGRLEKGRKSIGEGLRTRASFSEGSASAVKSRNNSLAREDMAAWGRFSGGLDYNYEGRAAGVSGSAGTGSRGLDSIIASSKSLQWRHQYGVDLTDVPIVLQRA
ncbi:hypothetical protein BDU57DRAFT_558425 [Ampelomyces quisqualis]|uniref:Uncharacterized protein n=1 Tax=Ampelomyces quisqualis TaxID=50730 RepID=A0A6A5QHR8_AMPQU|nr:hypothetical protein BDU57DRAFT_558425 [Ampelomyces quisqualis]